MVRSVLVSGCDGEGCASEDVLVSECTCKWV